MYKLLQKTIGVKQLSVIAKINIKEINDICYSDNYGFFFLSNQCVGLLDKSGNLKYPILGKEGQIGEKAGYAGTSILENPTSIFLIESLGELLVLEEYGKLIRSINLRNNYDNIWKIPSNAQDKVNKIMVRDYSGSITSLFSNNYDIAWGNSKLNIVFILNRNGNLRTIGSEEVGFSISNKDNGYMFNEISGLSINGDRVYVSDKNNHCIRSFNLDENRIVNHRIDIGNPMTSEISPKKSLFIKDNIFFISENRIVTLMDNKVNDIYLSDNIVTITNGPQNKLTILEKENA